MNNKSIAGVCVLALCTFVGCAPPLAAATSTTAADVPSASAAAPAAAPAVAQPESMPPVPGQLACRTKTATEGTSELFLEWEGATAKGILRRRTPSGMVYEQRVRAERSNGVIIADDPHETDLVTHAATVGPVNGKPHMRVGDGSRSFAVCEQ